MDAEDQNLTVQLSNPRHGALVALGNFSERFPIHNQGKGPRVWTDGKGVARKTRLVIDTTQIVVAFNPHADKSLIIVRESAESILREVRRALEQRSGRSPSLEESKDVIGAHLAFYIVQSCQQARACKGLLESLKA